MAKARITADYVQAEASNPQPTPDASPVIQIVPPPAARSVPHMAEPPPTKSPEPHLVSPPSLIQASAEPTPAAGARAITPKEALTQAGYRLTRAHMMWLKQEALDRETQGRDRRECDASAVLRELIDAAMERKKRGGLR